MISYEKAIEIVKKEVRRGYTITDSYENDKFWIFTICSDEILSGKYPRLYDGKSELSVDKKTGKYEWSAFVKALDIFLPEEYQKLKKTYKKLNIKCEGSD